MIRFRYIIGQIENIAHCENSPCSPVFGQFSGMDGLDVEEVKLRRSSLGPAPKPWNSGITTNRLSCEVAPPAPLPRHFDAVALGGKIVHLLLLIRTCKPALHGNLDSVCSGRCQCPGPWVYSRLHNWCCSSAAQLVLFAAQLALFAAQLLPEDISLSIAPVQESQVGLHPAMRWEPVDHEMTLHIRQQAMFQRSDLAFRWPLSAPVQSHSGCNSPLSPLFKPIFGLH